jgi:hypothetical protein
VAWRGLSLPKSLGALSPCDPPVTIVVLVGGFSMQVSVEVVVLRIIQLCLYRIERKNTLVIFKGKGKA